MVSNRYYVDGRVVAKKANPEFMQMRAISYAAFNLFGQIKIVVYCKTTCHQATKRPTFSTHKPNNRQLAAGDVAPLHKYLTNCTYFTNPPKKCYYNVASFTVLT